MGDGLIARCIDLKNGNRFTDLILFDQMKAQRIEFCLCYRILRTIREFADKDLPSLLST